MNFYRFFAVGFLFFSSTNFAIAESYLSINSISPNLLSPALTANSKEWQDEVILVLKVQKNIDFEALDEALTEKHLQPETIVQGIEPKMSRKAYPKLYYLLDRVGDTSRGITDNIKNHWNQTRPYLADSRIQMLITPSKGGSYPSGHATGSYIYAHVMSILIPEKRQEFQKLAEKIGQHRILIGMHYPRDVEAGRQLSFLIVGAMTQNPDFQKDLQKAAAEIRLQKAQ